MTTYFAALLVPDDGTLVGQVYPLAVPDRLKLERHVALQQPPSEAEAQRLRAELAGKVGPNAAVDLQLWVPRLDPGASQAFGFELYHGPKDLETAALPGYGYLYPVIESSYGTWVWLYWINRTLLQILRTFHGLVGNWGVAIILLTLLVKGLLFPLNRRQQTSMARYAAVMQRLKPQLDELKAKYKNNMRKYNEEQMKLIRAEGASPPVGGCLLMFLQLPVWVGLFQILGSSIELRQSYFVGWIDDLSRPDRMPFGFFGFETINLLPLLMSAATMVQMRFQTKPADPAQAQSQKIMGLLMPVVMLFFLYGYSSGLSLYIFTSSLIGIFEFHVIRRIWPVPGMAVPARAPVPARRS
jgi:YidC/Oxa1 family membrane protein insertase